MTTVRCTIEMELVEGTHFFAAPDDDDKEIIGAAIWAFVEKLDFEDIFNYVQAKIVDDIT